MLFLLVMLFLALAIAAAVAIYVAYPHRGETMPVVPQVGAAMKLAADAIPVLDADEVRAARRD